MAMFFYFKNKAMKLVKICGFQNRNHNRTPIRFCRYLANPSETNPYTQESYQYATAKQKSQPFIIKILRLDFTWYKMMSASNSTTIKNFQFANSISPYRLGSHDHYNLLTGLMSS